MKLPIKYMNVKEIEDFLIKTKYRNFFIRFIRSLIITYNNSKLEKSHCIELEFNRWSIATSVDVVLNGNSIYSPPLSMSSGYNTRNINDFNQLLEDQGYLGAVLTKLLGFEVKSAKSGNAKVKIRIYSPPSLDLILITPLVKALINVKDEIYKFAPGTKIEDMELHKALDVEFDLGNLVGDNIPSNYHPSEYLKKIKNSLVGVTLSDETKEVFIRGQRPPR